MKFLLLMIEKALTSLLVAFILFFMSFSYMTGHFPPRKHDMRRAFNLVQQMFFSAGEYNQEVKSLHGQPPSMEQIVHLQRLGLKRTEVSLEFQKIFKRFPQGVPNEEIAHRLQKVSNHLMAVEDELKEVNQHLENIVEGQ